MIVQWDEEHILQAGPDLWIYDSAIFQIPQQVYPWLQRWEQPALTSFLYLQTFQGVECRARSLMAMMQFQILQEVCPWHERWESPASGSCLYSMLRTEDDNTSSHQVLFEDLVYANNHAMQGQVVLLRPILGATYSSRQVQPTEKPVWRQLS